MGLGDTRQDSDGGNWFYCRRWIESFSGCSCRTLFAISCSAQNAIRIEQTADKPTHPSYSLTHTHTHTEAEFLKLHAGSFYVADKASSSTRGKFNRHLEPQFPVAAELLAFLQTRMRKLNIVEKIRPLCSLNRWTFCYGVSWIPTSGGRKEQVGLPVVVLDLFSEGYLHGRTCSTA